MLRGPLYRADYRPQLSGHETFPLRYGWLKKAYDAVLENETREVFTGEDAIARFGVGKNMVASMRHWATVSGIIAEDFGTKRLSVTDIGKLIFDDDEGLDPYMENLASAWLLHWILCTAEEKTTWFWAFHHYTQLTFDRDSLVEGIGQLAREVGWTRASLATIRRDVSCFIRTYVPTTRSAKQSYEDGLESPLTELGLIRPVRRRDGFWFVRGVKPTLGRGVFCYAVTDFWKRNFQRRQYTVAGILGVRAGLPGTGVSLGRGLADGATG